MEVVVILRHLGFSQDRFCGQRACKLHGKGMAAQGGIHWLSGRVVEHLLMQVADIAEGVCQAIFLQKNPAAWEVCRIDHLRFPLALVCNEAYPGGIGMVMICPRVPNQGEGYGQPEESKHDSLHISAPVPGARKLLNLHGLAIAHKGRSSI